MAGGEEGLDVIKDVEYPDGSVLRLQDAKDDPRAASCIEEILAVCERHGFTLSHEDGQGAFELWTGAPESEAKEWLRAASLKTEIKVADKRPSMYRSSCAIFGCTRETHLGTSYCEAHKKEKSG